MDEAFMELWEVEILTKILRLNEDLLAIIVNIIGIVIEGEMELRCDIKVKADISRSSNLSKRMIIDFRHHIILIILIIIIILISLIILISTSKVDVFLLNY